MIGDALKKIAADLERIARDAAEHPAAFDIACKRIEDAQRQGDFFVEAAA